MNRRTETEESKQIAANRCVRVQTGSRGRNRAISMDKALFYDKIGVTEKIRRIDEQTAASEQEYLYLKKLLQKDHTLFCEEVRSHADYRQRFLHLYLRLALDAYEDYQKAGISDAIYFDTMEDIVVWAGNCEKRYGETGIEESDWIRHHVTLELFKIGRLQYEVKGDGIYYIHIPQGSPLLPEECKDSIKRAERFFGGFKAMECHSWLLNPHMERLLNKDSNIMRFQSLFEVYGMEEDSREAEERIFTHLKDDPTDYPEDTALQRALKKYLMDGGRFGSAVGRLKEEP